MKRFIFSKRGYLVALLAIAAVAGTLAAESCNTLLASPPSILAITKSQPSELPDDAILIALGHDSFGGQLQSFADFIQGQLHRRVVTYRQFSDVHYISQSGQWWDQLPFAQVTAIVEQALHRAVAKYSGRKVIAFNLDEYDPNELFGPHGEPLSSYTNFEVRLLLQDRRMYFATRWYRKGREMTAPEADAFWAPVLTAFQAGGSRP